MTRIQVRNLWFQVHKWIGLILCVVLIPLSLTGSALVWDEALDRLLHPARFAPHAPASLPLSRYIAAATPLLPAGERVGAVSLPGEDGGAVVVRLMPPGGRERSAMRAGAERRGGEARGAEARAPAGQGGPPRGRMRQLSVWLDPASAAVIDSQWSDRGTLRVLHIFHGSLMVPGIGRAIVGWLGVLMLISSLSGLWIWWPTIGAWARGLRWRRGTKLDYNLHHMVGFWIALPLAVLSLTGAWISFPAFFGALTGEGAARRPGGFGGGFGGRPVAEARLTPDAAAALVAEWGRLQQLSMPVGDPPTWNVTVRADRGPPQRLEIDDASGEVTEAEERGPRGGIARMMRVLHDGTGTGIVWQTIIFLGGIAPAILGVTGVTMWVRSRKWRGKAAARGRPQPVPAE